MPRPSRVFLFVVVGLVALAGLLVGAELAWRQRVGDAVQVRFYRHARLRRAMVRDVDYNGVVHINRLGFRGPDFDLEKAPGTTRVVVVGASTTFDPCARSDAETWPARLEHWLEQLAPGRSFHVVNAGVSGFPMIEQVIRLQTELYALEPDVIVVYAGHGIVSAADAHADERDDPHTPDAAPIATPWDSWLREHSRLYERLRPQTEGRRDARLDDAQWARAVDNASAAFERDLRAFVLVARGMGARVVLAEINRVSGDREPSEFSAEERAKWERLFATPPEVVFEGYRRFRDAWQTVADSAGATFLPEQSIGIRGPEHYCAGDPIHFNTAGAEAMGRRMAERLLASGVL